MDEPARILHLEDNALDAELIQQRLKLDHPAWDIVWARCKADFEHALAHDDFDLILCDYNLPDYDGMQALAYARASRPHVPVILITGTLSEEEAVGCMKAGATDYVLKDSLERLVPAASRALREAAEQRARREVDAALRVSEERLQLALEAAEVSVWEYDLGSGHVAFSRQLGPMLGYSAGEVPARIDSWEALTHPQDVKRLRVALARHYRGETPLLEIEYRVRARDGSWRWLQTVGRTVKRDEDGRALRMSGTHRDVTERRRADEMLRLQQQSIDAATNAILIVDSRAPDFPIVHINRAFEKITGYERSEVIGRNCRFLQRDDRDQPDLERLRDAIVSGEEASALLRNYRKDGTLFWNNVRISPVRNESGTVTHYVGVQTDVTELKQYEAELEFRANYDGLTGLCEQEPARRSSRPRDLTHRQVAPQVFAALTSIWTVSSSSTTVFGHACGDELLKTISARLRRCVRESDTVARLGGDEFAVVLHDVEHASAVANIAQKILHEVEQPLSIDAHQVFTTTSIGVCLFPEDGNTREDLLKNADTAMYRAKHAGRNQVCFYTEDLNAGALARLELEAALRRALTLQEFELHYQPRIELASGRVTSVEALIRWRRPEHGLVSPIHFIGLAEETGLIVPIGEWVLRTACMQMREWRDAGYDRLRVAINLSPRQFRQPDIVAMIGTILTETGLTSSHIELEITESMAMEDPAITQQVLEKLSAVGICHAIDDFGTGYSSLAYLKRFPIDYLKIDQSFVRGVPEDLGRQQYRESDHRAGTKPRYQADRRRCRDRGAARFPARARLSRMQGYLFCRPKPAHELTEAFLR
jgi:diguanylate cyclase (GGDEF)-like protein/PAS domain S-box-containing protein